MSSTIKITDPKLAAYVADHSSAPDELAQRLIDETQTMRRAVMQISPAQAQFMALLTRLLSPSLAIEIGTFTGYSALAVARELAADAKLIACDVSEKWTSIGRRYWDEAGVADRIDLRIAPAAETLAGLPADTLVDLAFIDADKPAYLGYLEQLIPFMHERSVVLVDNVLWDGQVVDESDTSEATVALREFNASVVADPRLEVAVLPVGDGVSMITLARL